MTKMKKLLTLISFIVMLSSCGVEVLQKYGVDAIVFPESRQDILTLHGSLKQDTLITSIAVHRTGVSPEYPAKTIEIFVNTDSVSSLIDRANAAVTPTTEQLWFKGAMVLPAECLTLLSPIVIPVNGRTASLPLTLNKAGIDKLNKSQVWITAFSISPVSDITLINSNTINFLKIEFK